MQEYIIAPSLLSANVARLGQEAEAVLKAGADWIHLDVMDNHYVPNLTFGPMVCQALRQYGITAPIDVHLMTAPVDDLVPKFMKAGATYITVHPEATFHLDRTLTYIREEGGKAGVAFNPTTPLTMLPYIIEKIDMVLLMSVNPGFAGQSFLNSVYPKLQEARQIIDKYNPNIRLQIDGGIHLDNIEEVCRQGADTFVSGSAIFSGKDYSDVIQKMRQALPKKTK